MKLSIREKNILRLCNFKDSARISKSTLITLDKTNNLLNKLVNNRILINLDNFGLWLRPRNQISTHIKILSIDAYRYNILSKINNRKHNRVNNIIYFDNYKFDILSAELKINE